MEQWQNIRKDGVREDLDIYRVVLYELFSTSRPLPVGETIELAHGCAGTISLP
jgi:hypothetical protein